MIWLYIASAIFGGAFVIPMVLGGIDFDAEVGELDMGDVDFDAGLDVGELDVGELDLAPDAAGFDLASSGADFASAVGDFVSSLLNFRSIVLGATFFGVSGMVFTAFGTNVLLAFITALVLGFVAASVNSAVTTFVFGQEQSSHVTMRDMKGTSAQVTLPIADGRRGRVRAQVAGQTEDFTALPYKTGHEFAAGETVVVIEIADGIARVASLRELTE